MIAAAPPANASASIASLRWQAAGWAFCALMFAIHGVAAWHSAGVGDFWRDAYWATVIAHGERWPLAGPPINNLFELGPWWWYVLALPVAATRSVTAAAVCVQLLAALKYPLALRLGTRCVDARFGALFAASLAVAGWSTAALWFPSHPALIETCLLALALATQRGWFCWTPGSAGWFGLAAAACLHAHPSTVPCIALAGASLLWRHRRGSDIATMGVAVTIVVASLAPAWFDASARVPNLPTTLGSWAGDDIGVDFWQRLPRLVRGLLTGGADFGFLAMTRWHAGTAQLAGWVYAACLAIALAGFAVRSPSQRPRQRLALWCSALWLAQISFLLLVRHFTPVWMVPTCLPMLAAVIALGWRGWLDARGPVHRVAMVVACAYFALSLWPFAAFLRTPHEVRVLDANPLFDAGERGTRFTQRPAAVVTVRMQDTVATQLCEPVTLHAKLVAAVEGSSASAVRNACGAWPALRYAGQQGAAHLAGLTTAMATAAGIVPEQIAGGFALFAQVRPLAPEQGAVPAGLRRMEVERRPPDESSPRPLRYDFDAGATDVIALTNRYPTFRPMRVLAVHVGEARLQALYDDGRTQLFRAPPGAVGLLHWQVEIEAVEANIDLVAISAPAATR